MILTANWWPKSTNCLNLNYRMHAKEEQCPIKWTCSNFYKKIVTLKALEDSFY